MLGAKYPQILDPLRKGSGAFRTGFSKLSIAGTSRWGLLKSLGSAAILGLGSSARHHMCCDVPGVRDVPDFLLAVVSCPAVLCFRD